jgi:hypothetical protein
MVGEEDLIGRETHSSNLQCVSQKGEIYKMAKALFFLLRGSFNSWMTVLENCVVREQKSSGCLITSKPIKLKEETTDESRKSSVSHTPLDVNRVASMPA